VELDGTPYLINKSSLELDEEDRGRHQQRDGEGAGLGISTIVEHTDSGLADMDLAGVGGNPALADDCTPRALDEMRFDTDDRDG